MNQKLFNFSKTGGGSGGAGGGATAASIIYDNSVSGLIADDVQKAIDEIAALSGGAQGPAGTSPITTEGDIIVGDSSGDPDRLPVGNEGEVLTVVGGVPAWAAASGGGGDFLVMQVFS